MTQLLPSSSANFVCIWVFFGLRHFFMIVIMIKISVGFAIYQIFNSGVGYNKYTYDCK